MKSLIFRRFLIIPFQIFQKSFLNAMAIFLAVYYVNKLNFQYQTFFTSQDNKQLVLCIYIFRERERDRDRERGRGRERERSVTYPGRLRAWYTSLGAQTLAPKKGFLTFYLKIFLNIHGEECSFIQFMSFRKCFTRKSKSRHSQGLHF